VQNAQPERKIYPASRIHLDGHDRLDHEDAAVSASLVADPKQTQFGPWNPGVQSQVPTRIRHLCTIFRPQNVTTSVAEVAELRDLTGLDASELVTFRPERLALHELLIRVNAELSVPDGSKIEDLGINFRRMTSVILGGYIEPRMQVVASTYDALKRSLQESIDRELGPLFSAAPASRDALVAEWEAKAHAPGPEMQRAVFRALARIVSALLVRHGEVWGSRELVRSLATNLACNGYGSEEIGRLLEPWIDAAAKGEGYAVLPRQDEPVVMNTKGPSASGKSTLRPLQKALAGKIGVRWSEFALISPDIWRKQLVDYGTLGTEYKYGGAFTAEELQLIDHKLDRYMARKAERGFMPHLLIDRFRFDSFAPDSDEPGSNLLTRFGRIVYLFFMITPPASLVERAWNRGLEVGRYKAVDDTLAHGVEAYSGMPELFFTWAQRTDKRVHFEFLDNSVKFGERPRTVAFGWNDELNVLDVRRMLDVVRYRRVNIDATAPELLYPDESLLEPERNTEFLRQCVERFRAVNFADQPIGRVYLRLENGRPVWTDAEALARALADRDTRVALNAILTAPFEVATARSDLARSLTEATAGRPTHTLGHWGS
jgi:hypothetical protein